MSDEDAYMALALNNAQGELHPLEVGLHALRSGLDIKAYAERAGSPRTTLQHTVNAARVVTHVGHSPEQTDRWRHLAEIHAAPRWLWRALVVALPFKDAVRLGKQGGKRVKGQRSKSTLTTRGTTADYTLARLERDRPDLAQRVREDIARTTVAGEQRARNAKLLDLMDRAMQRTPADNKPLDNVQEPFPSGNSASAALRRLRKDRPDLHERVMSGELMANAAGPVKTPGNPTGADQHSGKRKGSNTTIPPDRGATYTLRRLKRDRPDLARRK